MLIKGIKERQGAILRDFPLGGWVFIFKIFIGGGRGSGRNFVAKHDSKPPASTPKKSLILFNFFFQSFVTLSFHSSTIYAYFWFKIILIGICSCLSAFYHTLMCMLWFNFIPGLIFFSFVLNSLSYITILQNKGI